MILTITPLWQCSENTELILWFNPSRGVCISLFIFKYKNNVYFINAPIISKTVGIMGRDSINCSGGYMIYIRIALAKKKFDYCIIDSELRVIKMGIQVNNIYSFM